MFRTTIALVAAAGLLAACGGTTSAPPAPSDPVTQALVGKTLTSGNAKITLQEYNKMVGVGGPFGAVPIDGAWEIRDGQFCRTLTAPPQLAGTECQDVVIEGDTVTFTTSRGAQTYIIADS